MATQSRQQPVQTTEDNDGGWQVYIVRCADDTLYTGVARDVEKRVLEHNESPRGAKYTKGRRPVVLMYSEDCDDRSQALRREHVIKQLSRTEKIKLIDDMTYHNGT